jgi:hypothetical protein
MSHEQHYKTFFRIQVVNIYKTQPHQSKISIDQFSGKKFREPGSPIEFWYNLNLSQTDTSDFGARSETSQTRKSLLN